MSFEKSQHITSQDLAISGERIDTGREAGVA